MEFPTIIMNFTHVYEEEFRNRCKYRWIDCSKIEGTDCYCDSGSENKLEQLIKNYSPHGIHFIDSGNYHYVTKLWTDKITIPFSLILFDHHPDMQTPIFEELISCGSWVKNMLESNRFLQKVYIIGATDKLRGEVEEFSDRVIFFSENYIKDINNWIHLFAIHIEEPVYISVDKDVLSSRYAATNWDQGTLSLTKMEQLLNAIMANEKVIGIDVCGELPEFEDNVDERNTLINEMTNLNILHFVKNHLVNK